VPHGGHTIGIDTSHITRDGGTFFETAARLDPGPLIDGLDGRPWHRFQPYVERAQALAGHRRWAERVRKHGLPEMPYPAPQPRMEMVIAMLYFADADGSGTGNGCRKLVRFHCDGDADYGTLLATRCEIWGNGSWHPTTTRRYAVECARGEIWERIVDANVAHAQRAHEAYYAAIVAKRR
jgi:hypothetical protein